MIRTAIHTMRLIDSPGSLAIRSGPVYDLDAVTVDTAVSLSTSFRHGVNGCNVLPVSSC